MYIAGMLQTRGPPELGWPIQDVRRVTNAANIKKMQGLRVYTNVYTKVHVNTKIALIPKTPGGNNAV